MLFCTNFANPKLWPFVIHNHNFVLWMTLWTRMHSSRMRTTRSLTVSRRILCTTPPATTHAPLATMHTPQQPCMPPSNHAHPLATTHVPSNHTRPPATMHAPLAARHAPWQPHMPPGSHAHPPATTQPPGNHARPPGSHTRPPPCGQNHRHL